MAYSSARRFWAYLIAVGFLAACTATQQPVATVAPLTAVPTAIPIPTLEYSLREFLEKASAQLGIKLTDLQTDSDARTIAIAIEPVQGQTPKAAAETAMGILVNAASLDPNPTMRPQSLFVYYIDGVAKYRLVMREPTISELVAGRINEEEAVRHIEVQELR